MSAGKLPGLFFPGQTLIDPFSVHADAQTDLQSLIDYANDNYDVWSISIAYVQQKNTDPIVSATYYYLYIPDSSGVLNVLAKSVLIDFQNSIPAFNNSIISKYSLTDSVQYNRLHEYVPSLESLGAYMLFENPENHIKLLKEYPFTAWFKGNVFTDMGYTQANRVSVSSITSQYLIFYSSKRVEYLNLYDTSGNIAYSFQYKYRYLRGDNYYHIFKVDVSKTDYFDFHFSYNANDIKGGFYAYFLPVYWGFDTAMTDDMRVQAFLPTQSSQSVSNIEKDLNEQNKLIQNQIDQDKKQHQEIMDTGSSSQASSVGNGIFDSGNEKFGSLLYPVQWTIDTASALANVDAQGSITLPAIFKPDQSYTIQFDILEKQIPQLFLVVRSVIFVYMAWTLIKGIYNLITGGNES